MKRQKFTRFVSILIFLSLLPIWLWASFSAAAKPPAAGGDVDSYLPILHRPLPTPTPTATPIPMNVIVNGNFEAGPTVWQQFSSNGWQLILSQANLPLPPHGGSWAAWLGGDDNESSILSQNVTIPMGNTTLTYWLWIASQDFCGDDVGGVLINDDEVVDAYWLCTTNNTGGWIRRDVDLGAYAGQTVELVFAVFTNGSVNSNLFLDDISLGLTAVAAEPTEIGDESSTVTKVQKGIDINLPAPNPAPVVRYRELLQEALGGVPE